MNKSLKHNLQYGVTLIEVMVTAFILAIGILAIGGLQIISKQSSSEAIQRTTATMLANDILERMRANPASLGSYVNKTVGDGSIGTEPSPTCTSSGSACTVAEIAAHDIWEWEQALDGVSEQITATSAATGGLVTPTGCITGPATGVSAAYTVTIVWRGKTELTNANTANTCGDGKYGTNNEFRRILEVTTFIDKT